MPDLAWSDLTDAEKREYATLLNNCASGILNGFKEKEVTAERLAKLAPQLAQGVITEEEVANARAWGEGADGLVDKSMAFFAASSQQITFQSARDSLAAKQQQEEEQ